MSDVPPSANELDCLICGFVATTTRGLKYHRVSVHKVFMSTGGVRRMLKLPAAAESASATPSNSASVSTRGGGRFPTASEPRSSDDIQATDDAMATGGPSKATSEAFAVVPTEGHAASEGLGSRTKSGMDAAIAASVTASRVPAPPLSTRKRKAPGGMPVSNALEYRYSSAAAHVRGLYEDMGDEQRSIPLVRLRKAAKTGLFNTHKLRVLQRFVLKTGRGGLSLQDQEELYTLLGTWDGSRPGLALDAHDTRTMREVFGGVTAFKQAIADDLDAAVVAAGWRKVNLVENGMTYRAYYRPVLDVVLALLDGQRVIQLWSGDGGPAPPSDRRESPMDGDAFRLCEADTCGQPGKNCVLGLHVYTDGSHISWSGGAFGQFCISLCCLVQLPRDETLGRPWKSLVHVFGARLACCSAFQVLTNRIIWRHFLPNVRALLYVLLYSTQAVSTQNTPHQLHDGSD